MPETHPPRQSMNFLRLGFALLLWPGLVATLLFFGKLFRNITQTPGFPWAGVMVFAGGFILACVAFFALPRPRGIYVLGHELTHALAVWMSGGKVHSLQASSKGGKVLSDRVSPWISLAPYIFPFYPMIAGILWLAGTRIWPELQQFPLPVLGLWGAIWGVPLRLHLRPFPDSSTRLPDLWQSFLPDLDSSWKYFPHWRVTLVNVSTLSFRRYLAPSRKRLGLDLYLHRPLDHRPALALPTSFRLKHLPRACSRPYQGDKPDRRPFC